jgi:hypothetical protein
MEVAEHALTAVVHRRTLTFCAAASTWPLIEAFAA